MANQRSHFLDCFILFTFYSLLQPRYKRGPHIAIIDIYHKSFNLNVPIFNFSFNLVVEETELSVLKGFLLSGFY